MLFKSEYNSPIGKLLIVCDAESLVGLFIENQKYFMEGIDINSIESENDMITRTKRWLDDYFNGKKPNLNGLKLNPKGTTFRKIVWQQLLEIPYGKVTTYGEISQKVALLMDKNKMSAQAIGGAISHNPISIIIPCHRVIGSHGDLVGYAGGITKKQILLQLENRK